MLLTKKIKYIALILLLVLFEQMTAKYFSVGGAVPMFAFCFLLTAAMNETEFSFTAVFSAFCGFLCDIMSGAGIGTYILTFTLSALAVLELHNKLFSSRVLFIICAAFILTFFVHIMYFIFHISDIGAENFMYGVLNVMLKSAVYNVIISLLFMPAVRKLLGKGR